MGVDLHRFAAAAHYVSGAQLQDADPAARLGRAADSGAIL